MPEGNLKYLNKSDFGGMRSRRGKRKPNQLFVYHTAIQCFDFPSGPHFNKLPVQLILEIFKYLYSYELLRKVSLVCKYWYNLCRDRALWTSITWNGTPRTLEHLLQLTKYQVHELVLTDNLFTFSDKALVSLLKKCTHLNCLKLPQNACRELFKRELPRTKIIGRISYDEINLPIHHGFSELWDDLQMSDGDDDNEINLPSHHGFSELWDDLQMSDDNDEINLPSHHGFSELWDDLQMSDGDDDNEINLPSHHGFSELWDDLQMSDCDDDNEINLPSHHKDIEMALASVEHKIFLTPEECIPQLRKAKDIEMALASVEHKRFLTPEEFISQHIKGNRCSQHPDKTFSIELESLEYVLQRNRVSRSVRIYETATKSPKSYIRNTPFQDCRMDTRQHQPCKRKPRPPKGRSHQHKEVRKFRRLQKRFKLYSLK